MKKFKLMRSEGLLSESLNNSNAINTFDADAYKVDSVARGRAIISVTKNNKHFQKELFENAVKDAKENTLEKMSKLKSKRHDLAKNAMDKSLSNSISDLIIPKKLKINKPITATSKANEILLESIPSVSKCCYQDDINLVSIPCSSSNNEPIENTFKTPKSFIKSLRSFDSPMFTSSPLIQSRNDVNFSDNISTPVDYSLLQSSSRNSMPSPIVKERKSVTFESDTLKKDISEKDMRAKKKIKKSKIKNNKKQKKASLISIDNESRNIDQNTVFDKNLSKNVDETEKDIKSEHLKRKSSLINDGDDGASKKPMYDNYLVMDSPEVNKIVLITSNEITKRVSSSNENTFKAPKHIRRSLKSSQSAIVTSSPIISVRNKKADNRVASKSAKVSFEHTVISPITRRTRSYGDKSHPEPVRSTRSNTADQRQSKG